jgi:16S rRNA (cytosine967-C5)-methyltransferase
VTDPRAVALEALVHIERDGSYANLALPAALSRGDLSDRDRAFATELVYGTLRMRRACDWLVDRFVAKPPDLPVRMALRLGAYQLAYLGTAPHAAVDATVSIAPPYSRAFVNAVLRKVAAAPTDISDDASRLSYPDWIIDRLIADLGRDDAYAALEHMNRAPRVRMRDDGYIQDEASEWLADLVEAQPGMRVADLCAAPGGKATRLAATGALVVASDVRESRVRTMVANVEALESHLLLVVADARHLPLRSGGFDRVLVDAPCSGLGVLRRRPDARWRVQPEDVARLATLQTELVDAAVQLVAPGGVLVYGVCTVAEDETLGVDEHLRSAHPEFAPLDPPGPPWREHGRGGLLLPQDADTDGMFVLRLRRG